MGRAYFQIVVFVAAATLLFASCKKEGQEPAPPIPVGEKVFVVCEGSYGNGNSRLDLYFSEKDSLFEDVYKSVNAASLGDVFQSMTWMNGKLLLAVNNSDKIISLNSDLTLHELISVAKPRYILPVTETKAYISSLYTNKVFLLDAATMTITGSIALPAMNTEGMLLHNGKAYISTWDTASSKVYVINTTSDKVEDSIEVAGRAPSEVLMDKDEKLWVLSGNITKGKPSFWTKIDPATKQQLKVYALPSNIDPVRPVMNKTKDSLYFIQVAYNGVAQQSGIYRMSVYDQVIPSAPFIAAQANQYFWALGIHPNGDIYVGDPKGFTQKSTVIIYDANGKLKKQFNTGVGVGHFYFEM